MPDAATFVTMRERAGLTQQGAADLIPVERSQLSRIENGRAIPTWRVVLGMARVYRVKHHDIVDTIKGLLDRKARELRSRKNGKAVQS